MQSTSTDISTPIAPDLQRMTSEYIDTEDRIRLRGQVRESEVVLIWFTQRLLTRLLPHLFLWLEKQTDTSLPKEIVQSFAQTAARSQLTPEPSVVIQPDAVSWLVHSVDVTAEVDSIRLLFKGEQNQQVRLTLRSQQLRQWLSILQSLWTKGGWPSGLWPEWMTGNELGNFPRQEMSLH